MDYLDLIKNNLQKEMMLDIKKMPKEKALDLLIKTLCSDERIVDQHQFKQAIISREMLMSTGIGNGVALPHARLDGINGIIIGFARCIEGILYESVDDKPVHFIFMIAVSKEYEKDYLKLLAALATKLREESFLSDLLNAKTIDEIYELLTADHVVA